MYSIIALIFECVCLKCLLQKESPAPLILPCWICRIGNRIEVRHCYGFGTMHANGSVCLNILNLKYI